VPASDNCILCDPIVPEAKWTALVFDKDKVVAEPEKAASEVIEPPVVLTS
jgi:hypothetical protein